MKDYNEIANRVFQRRDEYLEQKRRKKAIFFRRVSIAFSCCIMLLIGVGIWQSDMLKKIEPSPDTDSYISSETTGTTTTSSLSNAVTTAITAAYTDITSQTTTITADSGAEHSKTTALSSSGKNNATTTVRASSESHGSSHTQKRTTASGMEIIVTSRSSASHSQTSAVSSGKPVTTSTSVRRTTSTTRHYTTTTRRPVTTTTRHYTTTTTRRPVITTTRHYITTTRIPPSLSTTRRFTTTTTMIYTTRLYTSTTRAYTFTTYVHTAATRVLTTRIYTSTYSPVFTMTTTAALTNYPWYTSTTATEPPVATSLTSTSTPQYYTSTTTIAPCSYFILNDTAYTVAMSDYFINIDDSDTEIGSGGMYSDTSDLFISYTAYKHDNFDPRFICKVKFDGSDNVYLGINFSFIPKDLGEYLTATDFRNSFLTVYAYDNNNDRVIDPFNKAKFLELLAPLADTPITRYGDNDKSLFIECKLEDVHDIYGYYIYYDIYISKTGSIEFITDGANFGANIGKENVNNIYQKLIE